MPFVNGRFVMRSQLLTDESGEVQKAVAPYSPAAFPVFREKVIALELGYTTEDARLYGSAQRQDTWQALLEAHDAGDSRLCSAEVQARKDYAVEDAECRKARKRKREDESIDRKIKAREKRKLLEAKREAALVTSLEKAALWDAKIPDDYWLDNRNGIVLNRHPTAIQEPKFYTHLRYKYVLDKYYAHASLYGKKEAVAIYGRKEVLIGKSPAALEKELDAMGDSRSDYVTEDYSHYPTVECEQFKRPAKWVEELTIKEIVASGCCAITQLRNMSNGSCFVDTLGRRWWKIVSPRQINFDRSPAVRGNDSMVRVLYCR